MSHQAQQDVLDFEGYPPAQKFALYRIAGVVNDMHDMRWWQKNDVLAHQVGVARETVSRWMTAYVSDGWLEVVSDTKGGRSRAVEYKWIGTLESVTSNHSIEIDEKLDTVILSTESVISDGNTVISDHTQVVEECKRVEEDLAPSALGEQGCLTDMALAEPEIVEATIVTNATVARDITTAFWDALIAEKRPTPVLGGNRNSFMALVGIIEQFVESGYEPQLIYNALHDTSVYTMNGITFSLNKQKREVSHRDEGSAFEGLAELQRLQKEIG